MTQDITSSTSHTTTESGPRLGSDGTAVSILRDVFQKAVDQAYPGMDVKAELVRTQEAKFGDYQLNNAMQLFGKLKKAGGNPPKNPREVAQKIIECIPKTDLVASTDIAGPGFINIRVSTAWIEAQLRQLNHDGIESWSPKLSSRVVVDFSSPNVAKEMHVGHLRSTIIGDTLCKTLEYCGADVLRLNHVGDWGTQFGMLIEHMRSGGYGDSAEIADLQKLYREAKKRFDDDNDFKTRARQQVKTLQDGDPESMASWNKICDASRKEFQAIYDRLNVSLIERGESFYNPMLTKTAEELEQNSVAQVSDGALCVFVEGSEVPLMLRKSDGGFGYASTDMSAIRQRVDDEKADWIIYVTDSGQKSHFDLVFAAAKKAGWLKDKDIRLDHVGFGLVLGEDGKRFRTRSGDLVRLVELLDEAKVRCRDTILERRPDIAEDELEAASSAMGYGAVKYADLKNNRLSNYKFSYDQMLSLQGDTAVYLLYAFARIAGIVRKSGVDVNKLTESAQIVLKEPQETALGLKLAQFPDAVSDTLDSLMPNRLTDYLYDLTEVFNQFYQNCKVIGSEEEESRLLLVEATAKVMRQCFTLLGIATLDRI
mmetsp:Transcript_4226/g.7721  ORF Transcript_4226/g.7721 Transcript_4226/m.7721 type:complete len:596 (+) Transcript_4226:519-2306(+)